MIASRKLSDARTFERIPGLEAHEAEEGMVVFDPRTDRIHHLNATAAVLFELCDGSRSLEEMGRIVTELFSLDASPLSTLEDGLDLLLREGVVRQIDTGSE